MLVKNSGDLSSDTQKFPDRDADLRLRLAQQQIGHRKWLFGVSIGAAIVMYLVFAAFLCARANDLDNHSLIALGVLAAMPTSLVLGLMRFVFRRDKDQDGDMQHNFSPLVNLVRELLEVVKDLWPKGKGA